MTSTFVEFFGSAVVIVLAARWLARAADDLARTTRLGHAFMGGLFLAASTSAPEFFVDIRATVDGLPNLAAGDLLGSSVMNLSILAVAVLCLRNASQEERLPSAMPFFALLAAVLTAEVGWLIHARPPGQLWGIHWGGYLIAATYLVAGRWIFRSTTQEAAREAPARVSLKGVLRPAAIFLIAATAIFVAAPLLVGATESIALATGLNRTFLGTTLLALTTSLPELVATATAVRLGASTLAAGNIVGSNAFNMLIFFFMDAVWSRGNLWEALSPQHDLTAFLVVANMGVLAIALSGPLRRRGRLRKVIFGLILASNLIGMAGLFMLTRGIPPQ